MKAKNEKYKSLESEILKSLKYDSATGLVIWISDKKGTKRKKGKQAGSLSNKYIVIKLKGKNLFSHRVAWFLHYGKWPNNYIDHINGTKNDNRIENLRDVTDRENFANQVKHRKGKLVGAIKEHVASTWRAQIVINKKQIYLGNFKTELEAHLAYKKALEKHNSKIETKV